MNEGSAAPTILDLLAAQRDLRGEAPAILAPNRQSLSYAELLGEIERTGDALAALGLGRGSRIAVALPAHPEAAVLVIAAMIWATCVPLDVTLGVEAGTRMLRRLRIDALIVGDDDARPIVPAAEALGLDVVRMSRRLSGRAGVFTLRGDTRRSPVVRASPQAHDVTLVIQTSGTTSEPKVVPLNHAQLLWSVRLHPVDSSDRNLHVAPLHARGGIGQGLLVPLVAGASVVVTGGFEAARCIDWLDEFRPTFFSGSPTIHAAFADAISERMPRLPHSLRFLRSSSSAMPPAIQAKLEALLGVPVIQGYGMTEASLIAQNPMPPRERRVGSVGLVMADELLIRGDEGARLPPGAIGEIEVRGAGVVSSYEDDADATRLAFRDGWFRTGDLGYLDGDGYLFITGRVKELINRGGLKISPNEVDALLTRHHAVSEAATCGIAHPSLGEDVVTAVVLRPIGSVTAEDLRQFALANLAAHKVPSSVVIVEALPKNASGKVIRRQLAETILALLKTDYVAPRDVEEVMVARMFEDLLGVTKVGALDHFFHLGGDSLRGAQLVARVAEQTGLAIALPTLFEAPTVALFAVRLRSAMRGEAKSAIAPLTSRRRDAVAAEKAMADPDPRAAQS